MRSDAWSGLAPCGPERRRFGASFTCYSARMKKLLLLSIAFLVSACEPMPAPDGGLDASDVAVAPDASPEASADVLAPHVDGGGID